jgi:hypothetical protein
MVAVAFIAAVVAVAAVAAVAAVVIVTVLFGVIGVMPGLMALIVTCIRSASVRAQEEHQYDSNLACGRHCISRPLAG